MFLGFLFYKLFKSAQKWKQQAFICIDQLHTFLFYFTANDCENDTCSGLRKQVINKDLLSP